MCAWSSACFKASSSLPACLRSKKGLPDTREDLERCRNHPGCYRASGKTGQKASREIRGEEKVQLGSLNISPGLPTGGNWERFFLRPGWRCDFHTSLPGSVGIKCPSEAPAAVLLSFPPKKTLFQRRTQNISSPCGCCGARCTCGRRTESAAAKKRLFAIKAARFGAYGCDFQQGSPRSHLVSASWGALCSLL